MPLIIPQVYNAPTIANPYFMRLRDDAVSGLLVGVPTCRTAAEVVSIETVRHGKASFMIGCGAADDALASGLRQRCAQDTIARWIIGTGRW